MRHASIQTTVNIYGKATTGHQAWGSPQSRGEMVLKSNKTQEGNGEKKPIGGIRS